MTEQIFALSMVFLEMLFLFVALAALCNQRHLIGKTGFVMSLGLMLFFSCLISGADIRAELWDNMTFQVGEVAVYMPALTGFLMVYVLFGVQAAQRLLCGIVIIYFLYLYFGQMIRLQCHWMGFSIFTGIHGSTLDALLSAGRTNVNITAVGHFLEFLTVPVIYSRASEAGSRKLTAVWAALFGALAAGMIPELLLALSSGTLPAVFNGNFYARSLAALALGALLAFYLEKLESDTAAEQHGTWDFLFAFFGSYSRVQKLETDLQERENRYQHVFQYTADAVITLNASGFVTDANLSALKLFNIKPPENIKGRRILEYLEVMDTPDYDFSTVAAEPVYFKCRIKNGAPDSMMAASCCSIELNGKTMTILIGRDITDEMRLAREKAALTEQLNHAQRLESLGMLAGGIAHDFNNYIHAILGHVDVATMVDSGNIDSLNTHLSKIGSIAEHAGKLTSQMLGFARKGKYNVVKIDLGELFENCRTLLGPGKLNDCDFAIGISQEEKWAINADRLQMQQVLMNMLLNAIDALKGIDRQAKLQLNVSSAANSPLKFAPPPEFSGAEESAYLCISIQDNGCGMSEDVAKRIFEPFFTTKPVGVGTGMGMAMVYGIIANHKGWVQLETGENRGTLFCIFLPRAE